MDELWKHYAKWKELVTKDCILYDAIYLKCPEEEIHRNRKQNNGFVGLGLEGNGEWLLMGMEFLFSSVQFSRVRLFATPWIAARQAFLSITISRSSLRLTSIESMMPSRHLILGCPLLLLPPIPPRIRVFSNESTLHMRCPKYWSFSLSIIPSKEIPGLISFRMDWLDLLLGQLKYSQIDFYYINRLY